MPLTDYAIAGTPDLTVDQLARILRDAQSPATPEAVHIHAALKATGVRPSVWLAFFRQESRFGLVGVVKDFATRNAGNVRSLEDPALGTVVQTPRGPFAKYANWADGAFDWGKRLMGPKYAGAGLTTVRTVLPRYAPSGDQDNSPTAYINAVLASIAEWTKGAPPVALSKPPVILTPSPNHGYPGDYRPEAVVWHISAGSGQSAVNWLSSPASNASSNFVIMESGEVVMLVDPENGQQGAAWANGAINKPNLGNPLVAKWVKEGTNPNRRCVSLEHAGFTSMGKGGSLTKAQIAATIRLTAWLCSRFGITPDRQHIIPHAFIDSVNRANCPGFSEVEWVTWVDAINEIVKSGGTTPPAPPSAPGESIRHYVNAQGVPVTEIVWGGKAKAIRGGNIVDLGISVDGDPAGVYHRSVRANAFKEWVRE